MPSVQRAPKAGLSELLAGDAVLVPVKPSVVPHGSPVEKVAASE
jgi:hypothetical protein